MGMERTGQSPSTFPFPLGLVRMGRAQTPGHPLSLRQLLSLIVELFSPQPESCWTGVGVARGPETLMIHFSFLGAS